MAKETPFRFDVALSFAGEDRSIAERLALLLRGLGIRTFYDAHERADLWGKDLYQHLQEVYRDRARFCVVFVSDAYGKKLWAKHELRQAQARAFGESREYILPVRLDDTQLPGLVETTGYVDLREAKIEEVAQLVLRKLVSEDDASTWPPTPRSLAEFSPKLVMAVDELRSDATKALLAAEQGSAAQKLPDCRMFIRQALADVAVRSDVDVELTCLDRAGLFVCHPWPGTVDMSLEEVWSDRPGFAPWVMGRLHEVKRGYLTWLDSWSSDAQLEREVLADRRKYARRTIVGFEAVTVKHCGLYFVAVEGHEIEALGSRFNGAG